MSTNIESEEASGSSIPLAKRPPSDSQLYVYPPRFSALYNSDTRPSVVFTPPLLRWYSRSYFSAAIRRNFPIHPRVPSQRSPILLECVESRPDAVLQYGDGIRNRMTAHAERIELRILTEWSCLLCTPRSIPYSEGKSPKGKETWLKEDLLPPDPKYANQRYDD